MAILSAKQLLMLVMEPIWRDKISKQKINMPHLILLVTFHHQKDFKELLLISLELQIQELLSKSLQ